MNETQNKNSEGGGKPITSVKIDEIIFNPNHPRKCIDLEDLARSIEMVGVLQPILVQKSEDGKIHLVAGERRVRASIKAGKTEIPAIFVNLNSAASNIIISLIENIYKTQLTPLDEAEALKQLKYKFLVSDRLLKAITGKTKKDLKEIWKINSLSKRVKECVHDIESTYGKVVAKSALIRLSAMEDDDEKIYELNNKYPYRWQRSKEDITRDKIKELNKTLVGLKKREKQESEKYGVETELYDLVGGIRDLMNPKGQKDWRGNRGLRELQNEIAKETR